MTAESEKPKTARGLWRRNGLIWAALISLTAFLAFRLFHQQVSIAADSSTGTCAMTSESESPSKTPPKTPPKTARDLWRRNGLIWAALMVLLISTLSLSYVPLGAANTPIALGIGATKAALVVWLFMELAKSSPLKRLAAATGLVWLCVMFTLTLADVIARLHGG